MSSNSLLKRWQRAWARNGLFFFYRLFAMIPYTFVKFVSGGILYIGYQFVIRQRKIAHESLTIAFGGMKSEREIRGIIQECFYNLGKGLVEMIYFMSHPKLVTGKVTFEGREHLERALAEGNGVIAVTAHFGNFPLMMLACAQSGYRTSAIVRTMRDEKLEEYLNQKRTECLLKTIYAVPRTRCVTEAVRALRNNEIVFVPLDQSFGSGTGVYVDFFGKKAATATGPIVFAQRTGARILPMFIVRQPDDKHKIIIDPPVEIEGRSISDGQIVHYTQKLTSIIEDYIRKYPHEWGWMHRRWKHSPDVNTKAKT